MKKKFIIWGVALTATTVVNAQQPLQLTGLPITNTAIIPVPKLEEDSYNWWNRHARVVAIKDSINPQILLIGDSITHFWGGLPELIYSNGQLRVSNGPVSWDKLFGHYRVLNLGFGWDRTQNVLWRIDHGEITGLHPRIVVINIGTNNTNETKHARKNTAPEIVDGIMAVYARVKTQLPNAKIVVMALFPRDADPLSPRRDLIKQVNDRLETLAAKHKITLVDAGSKMLSPDGSFLPGMMRDFTHPTDKGYQVWANAIEPYINDAVK